MGRFKLWILIGGVALGFYGFREWRLSGVVKSTPQEITCADLAKNGYGANANIKLKDFLLSPGGYVYEEKKRGGGRWNKVWIPVVPSEGPYATTIANLPEDADLPPPKSFNVILQSGHVANETALIKVANEDVLTGVVINEIDSLDGETKKLLSNSYPGIDIDKCWILDHRRKATGAGMSLLMFAGGLVLVGLSIWLFITGRKRPERARRRRAIDDVRSSR